MDPAGVSTVGGKSVNKKPVQENDESDNPLNCYYDLLFLGLTGQGKTTTVNKLLIANPFGKDYKSIYLSLKAALIDPEARQMALQDLCMWYIPSDPDALEKISTRMRNLAYYRTKQTPHKMINEARVDMRVNEPTQKCELLSNETTKVRVLDVPGFSAKLASMPIDFRERPLFVLRAHLGNMRSILHIQTTMAMKFKRILYFLPCRDSLQNITSSLEEELHLMFQYFGRSIFEAMVLVTTLGPVFYKMVPEGTPFPEDELERSRSSFQKALRSILPESTPNPPIIFISMWESCESILKKIQEINVDLIDGLQLELNSSICARCSMVIGERNGMKIACTSDRNWAQAIIYEHSHCHPILLPKYTTFQKITGGFSYAVKTVVLCEQLDWPDFNVEVCLNCKGEPGSKGCMLVKSTFDLEGETFKVEHTNEIKEGTANHRLLFQKFISQSEATPPSPDEDADVSPGGYEGDYEDNSEIRQQIIARDQNFEWTSSSYTSEGHFEQQRVVVSIEPEREEVVIRAEESQSIART
ncbi:uncharacterized protein LOC135338200 [Halichondria panicea]|uniref:uncharacterized protein LOC135338200 n=1 Tax=Halichondria panicea TaxID=6063 RepID=UPI00312B9B10